MKVKIGNRVYDSEETPIMVILNNNDKSNIANMRHDNNKYICFPKGMNIEDVNEFAEQGSVPKMKNPPPPPFPKDRILREGQMPRKPNE